eukprot:372467_1
MICLNTKQNYNTSFSSWKCENCGLYNNKDAYKCQACFMHSAIKFDFDKFDFIQKDKYININYPYYDKQRNNKKYWLVKVAQISEILNDLNVICIYLNSDKTLSKNKLIINVDDVKMSDGDNFTLKNGLNIAKFHWFELARWNTTSVIPYYTNMEFNLNWNRPHDNKSYLLINGYIKSFYQNINKLIPKSIICIISDNYYSFYISNIFINTKIFYWYNLKGEYWWDQRRKYSPAIEQSIISGLFDVVPSYNTIKYDNDLCNKLEEINHGLCLYPDWDDEDTITYIYSLIIKYKNFNLSKPINNINIDLIKKLFNELLINKNKIETALGVFFSSHRDINFDA